MKKQGNTTHLRSPLKITKLLSCMCAYSSGASFSMFQYGYGEVQKFACNARVTRCRNYAVAVALTFESEAPSGLSTGTESENTPEAMYLSHLSTIAFRCSRDSSDTGVLWGAPSWAKKVGERRDAVVDLKSGGVTSETNHGINLGLRSGIDETKNPMVATMRHTGRRLSTHMECR